MCPSQDFSSTETEAQQTKHLNLVFAPQITGSYGVYDHHIRPSGDGSYMVTMPSLPLGDKHRVLRL